MFMECHASLGGYLCSAAKRKLLLGAGADGQLAAQAGRHLLRIMHLLRQRLALLRRACMLAPACVGHVYVYLKTAQYVIVGLAFTMLKANTSTWPNAISALIEDLHDTTLSSIFRTAVWKRSLSTELPHKAGAATCGERHSRLTLVLNITHSE